jgi:hypothetical protein
MHSLCKSVAFSRSAFSKLVPFFGFSTTIGNTSGPLKVKRRWQINNSAYDQICQSVWHSYTVKMLYEIISENPHAVTENVLSFAWSRIEEDDLDTDVPQFEQDFVPLTMDYLRTFGRDEGLALGRIAAHAAHLRVKSQAFWDLIEKKIVEERLIRYIPNAELCTMIHKMGEANLGSKALYDACEPIFLKHLNGLELFQILEVRDGYRARKMGSQELMSQFSRVESDRA